MGFEYDLRCELVDPKFLDDLEHVNLLFHLLQGILLEELNSFGLGSTATAADIGKPGLVEPLTVSVRDCLAAANFLGNLPLDTFIDNAL